MRLAATALLLCGTAAAVVAGAASADPSAQIIDLPASELSSALSYLAQRYNVDLVYESSLVHGLSAPRLAGYMTAREALIGVLSPSGLALIENQPGSFLITTPSSGSSRPVEGSPETSLAPTEIPLRDVVVVGTHLSNEVPIGASISIYDSTELQSVGGVTLENLGRKMPANFSGADSLATLNTNGEVGNLQQGAAANIFGGAGFNLLGLGPGATLTLLNGHRLAPAGLDGSIIDMSLIPLSAVDHIEVLTDGASAIYGSDAVAGVVNVVTRTTVDEAESIAQMGRSTEGGGGQLLAAQLFGYSWRTGNALVDLEYTDQQDLDASEREWIAPQGSPYSLLPANIKRSIYLSGKQQLTDRSNLSLTSLYTTRSFMSNGIAVTADGVPPGVESTRGTVTQAVASATVEASLPRESTGAATLDYSNTHQRREAVPFGAGGTAGRLSADFSLISLDARASGELFQLPAGHARLSVGLAARYETFDGTYPSITPLPLVSQTRTVGSLYGEASVPIVDQSLGLQWARAVDVSLAYRLDYYSKIGTAANPKFGWAWQLAPAVKLKGTVGRSFKAPSLSQIYAPMTSYTTAFPGLPPQKDALIVEGGSQQLSPERSTSITSTIEFAPHAWAGFHSSASYFHIEYTDRIQTHNIESKSILDQALLISHAIENPLLSDVLRFYDIPGFQGDTGGLGPEGVYLIVDNRFSNSVSTIVSGLLVDVRYRWNLSKGALDLFANGAYVLSDRTQDVSWGASKNVVGTIGEPPKWKSAAGAEWNLKSFGVGLRVNTQSGSENVLADPPQSVSAWTTADLNLKYENRNSDPGFWNGLSVSLTVQNLLDRRPPLVLVPSGDATIGRPTIPFDGTNASSLGRYIELSLRKLW